MCSVRAKYLPFVKAKRVRRGWRVLGKWSVERCHKSMPSKSLARQETHPKGFSLLSIVRTVGTWKHIIWSQLFLFLLFHKWRNLAMYLTLRLIIFHLFFLILHFLLIKSEYFLVNRIVYIWGDKNLSLNTCAQKSEICY